MKKMVVVCACFVMAMSASAKDERKASWGLEGSYNISVLPKSLSDDLFPNKSFSLRSTGFNVGFVRGNSSGGDWGLSFVEKDLGRIVYDNSNFTSIVGSGSFRNGDYYRGSAKVYGAMGHKYFHFANLGRFQIGANIGAGAGMLSGTIQKQTFSTTGSVTVTKGVTTIKIVQNPPVITTQNASKLFSDKVGVSFMPLFQAQLVGAINLSQHLKLKIAGGPDLPGIGGEVGLVYFFGR